ncbi:hypothetical protein BLA29_011815, partial [Euroglyphus maynei]
MNDDFENFVDDSNWLDINKNISNHSLSESEPNINQRINQMNKSKSNNLADILYKALKNRIIALEIEKKIKFYLGDVTSSNYRKNQNIDDKLIRASRQSIVRTRSIQPLATFDFNFTREEKQSPILSVDLERCFPNEISTEMLRKIQHLEQNLLVLERNLKSGHLNRARMNQVLSY